MAAPPRLRELERTAPPRLREPGALRRLDAAVVPRMQRGARRLASRLAEPLLALSRWEAGFVGGRPLRALWRHRQLLLLAAAGLVFAGSYLHLQRYEPASIAPAAPGRPPTRPAAGDPAPPPAGAAVTVGPRLGADVATYIRQRQAVLKTAGGAAPRLAVVSFGQYLTGEQAARSLPRGATPARVQLRVPAEGEKPVEVEVTGGLRGLVAAVQRTVTAERERLAAEERELRRLIESGTVTDRQFATFYRREVDRLAATRNLLATRGGVVFAVVVRAPVADLKALAGRNGVRLVDLAPPETKLGPSAYYGLLPEDRTRVSYGEGD